MTQRCIMAPTALLSKLIRNNIVISNVYADDRQIYIIVKSHQEDTEAAVEQCVTEDPIWMKTNSLKLHDSTTEVKPFGLAQENRAACITYW